mgnify:CR=1 FL=1
MKVASLLFLITFFISCNISNVNKDEIVADSYQKLEKGILAFINAYHYEQFLLAIKGAGFQSNRLLNSKMTLNFAYYLFLKLSDDATIPKNQVKRCVQKWFVLSTLTGRYIGSPESVMSRDIRSIEEKGFVSFFHEIGCPVVEVCQQSVCWYFSGVKQDSG